MVLAGIGVLVWFLAFRTTAIHVRGTVFLDGDRYSGNYQVSAPDSIGNTTCWGLGGYSDIRQGASVTVTDGSGNTVAISQLKQGTWIPGLGGCMFPFEVTVPGGKDFYGIEVSHRGVVEFTATEMKRGPGLSLGP